VPIKEKLMATRLSTAGLLVLVLLLHSAGLADAGSAVGHITGVQGEVRLKRSTHAGATGADWVDAAFGMPVFSGDQIKTGGDGIATVEYGNKVRTNVMPGSIFTVKRSSHADSRHWKPFTEDLGMMVYTDEAGVTRGRLYVRVNEKWQPVAIESPEEFLPEVLPLNR
jgi:hypothetical protein